MPNSVRNHLFIIGINQYQSPNIRNLANAVNDASTVIEVLKDRYGFDNVVFLDNEKATRASILGQLKSYLNQLGQDKEVKDNLLVYFAGHGYFEKTYQLGYLIPFDGNIDENETLHNCIQNEELIKMLRPIKLHQLLVVSDSCFSGGLLLDSIRKIGIHDKKEETPEIAKRLVDKKCRWIIASALLTHASDGGFYAQNSPFAKRFVDILNQNDHKLLTSKRLLLELEESVVDGNEQTPVGGSWKYQDDGVDLGSAFVFMLTRSKDIQKQFDTCKKIEDFEKFMTDFPMDESGDLYTLALLHIDWLKTCEADEVEEYRLFYKNNPKSIFAQHALAKIDEHDWEDAKDIALDAFMNYKKKHRKGQFFDQANALIAYISQIEKHITPPQYSEPKMKFESSKVDELKIEKEDKKNVKEVKIINPILNFIDDFFMTIPSGERQFTDIRRHNFLPGTTFYKFYLKESGKEAEFEFSDKAEALYFAIGKPETHILKACEPQNAHFSDSIKIKTISRGKATLEEGIWSVTKKTAILYVYS